MLLLLDSGFILEEENISSRSQSLKSSGHVMGMTPSQSPRPLGEAQNVHGFLI